MGLHAPPPIRTKFSQQLRIPYPIIAAPMFLVSNTDLVVAASEAGGIGAFPALNFRPIEKYKEALKTIRSQSKKPIGVNIIVNKSNTRQKDDLKWALDAGVELFITSLGNPKEVIREAHKNKALVYCDVTNLDHGLKVRDLGADGVIAVSAGAGGHAGPLTPFVLIPWLKQKLNLPIIAAGGVAEGRALAAALCLGADGVSVGTRFIACKETQVDEGYKKAIVNASADDIVLTNRISGTPISVINTKYIEQIGLELPWWLKKLKENPKSKKWASAFIHWMGMRSLDESANKTTFKSVWSAGQCVGLIDDVPSAQEILWNLVMTAHQSQRELNERFL